MRESIGVNLYFKLPTQDVKIVIWTIEDGVDDIAYMVQTLVLDELVKKDALVGRRGPTNGPAGIVVLWKVISLIGFLAEILWTHSPFTE